jgi:hypothetical protein
VSGSNVRTRNTTEQTKLARRAVAQHVAANPSGDHLQDVCRLRLLLEVLALLPGQDELRVSSLEVRSGKFEPMATGGTIVDKRGDHFF